MFRIKFILMINIKNKYTQYFEWKKKFSKLKFIISILKLIFKTKMEAGKCVFDTWKVKSLLYTSLA